jgi:hypothetical protein
MLCQLATVIATVTRRQPQLSKLLCSLLSDVRLAYSRSEFAVALQFTALFYVFCFFLVIVETMNRYNTEHYTTCELGE